MWDVLHHMLLRYASLTSLFTGAKEEKFPYFTKGKPVSSWLLSKSSDIFLYKCWFCTSNSWPAFCFVLSPRSSLITPRPTSPAWKASTYDSRMTKVFITFEIWKCILKKCTDRLQEACIHAPELRETRFTMDACTLFDVLWTVHQKHPSTAVITLGIASTIFI